MIDREKLELTAQLIAIEYLLTRMLAAMMSKATDAQFDQLIEKYGAGLEKETLPGADPAQSDLAMAEVRDEVLRLLNATKEIRKAGHKP